MGGIQSEPARHLVTLAGKIDWGNVPAWVASLLSGLSVLLALSIIFRDRRKDGRAFANSVIVHKHAEIDGRFEHDMSTIYVDVINGKLAPIYNLELKGVPKSLWEIGNDESLDRSYQKLLSKQADASESLRDCDILEEDRSLPHLVAFGRSDWGPPKVRSDSSQIDPWELETERRVQLKVEAGVIPDCYNWYVVFLDATNLSWQRNLETWRLFPTRVSDGKWHPIWALTFWWSRYGFPRNRRLK